MKNWIILICLFSIHKLGYSQPTIGSFKGPEFSKTSFVNPFIGTGGHGHTYPGASTPFGMIQLSPDTRHEGWDGCSGYHYSDKKIYGFSHTHLSGTGVPDYCDLLILPQNGKPRIEPGYSSKKGYGSTFSHENEKASPGYYSVHLDDGDIDVQLSVTERAGFHEYTFNKKSGKKFIIIDLDHRDQLLSSSINIIDSQTIEGSRVSNAWATEQHFYFHLKLDTPYQKARIFEKDGMNKLLLIFPKSVNKINLKVGISAVDIEGAKNNVLNEIPNWNFEEIKNNANSLWENELNKIYIKTRDQEVMTNFYTALYHSYLNPNLFNDYDARYRGRDNKIHTLNGSTGRNYSVFSLWDTYRATHPLFTLLQTNRTNEFINTFLRQFDQGGDLPVWDLAANETECMIGYHSVSVIADAFTKGISNFNIEEAIEAMVATSNFNEFGKHEFSKNGFISTGKEPESVSKTLEYAYDDFCIAQMLKKYKITTGSSKYDSLYTVYNKRSFNFINQFDPSTGFMRGRNEGLWFSPFKPDEVNFNYTEANSWQYSLYAPHAVGTLSKLLGSKDHLKNWLDKLFSTESALSGRHQVDITGLIGQYAHGNEPSHHMAYLYNYTNQQHNTQVMVDSILYTMYSNTPEGLSGNEDCGQMSSWYVLSALGFYQIAPGNPYYEIGRPLLDRASITFENGNELFISAINNERENKYVRNVVLNGVQLDRNYLTHDELTAGGVILFSMGDRPNSQREKLPHAPTLNEIPANFIPAPYFVTESRIFTDSLMIQIGKSNLVDADIYYTTDGTNPLESDTKILYTAPFNISKSTTISMYPSKGSMNGPIVSNTFVKKDDNISIEIQSIYDNQYAASGDFTLVDGIRGANEYRTGDWQGYWDQNFQATVNFENPIKMDEIGIGCLSDMKSWIFLPESIKFEIAYVGKDYITLGEIDVPKENIEQMPPHYKNFTLNINNEELIRSVKVTIKPTEECPDWHLGKGNPTWLFLDEIFFR